MFESVKLVSYVWRYKVLKTSDPFGATWNTLGGANWNTY